MAVTTRKQQEMTARRRKVAALYLRGAWQSEIASSVGVSQATVSRDLAIVRRWWMEDAKRDYDARIAEELAKVDAVEMQAWSEWQKSKDRQRTKKSTKMHSEGQTVRRSEETTTVETLLPEARYLEIIHKCIERRCKLLGLDAPIRTDLTSDGRPLAITTIEVVKDYGEPVSDS